MLQKQKRHKWTGKYDSPYRKSFCKQVIELGQRESLRTQATLCKEIGVSFNTLDAWTNPNSDRFKPDFFEAMHTALCYMQAAWEERAIKELEGQCAQDDSGRPIFNKYNDRLWSKIMERWYGYVARSDTKINAVVSSDVDADEIEKLTEKYRKSC